MSNKRIHPSPLLSSSSSSSSSSIYLSCLPTALLALASTLTAQEQEVLSYLLDSEKPNNKKTVKSHAVDLGCSCFECYKSFWERWDSSPNRHIIHLILDEFEASLENKEMAKSRKGKNKSKKKKKKKSLKKMDETANSKKLVGVVKKNDDDDDVVFSNDHQVCDVMGLIKKLLSWILWN